ncbi:sarcosine dehydrogenase, mitochondrial-like [Perca fluviatilis]|uniref:sarcosine dehydrogenase, mitochondrial-like n=1 Tax=Perca fluviatilis TaxID=8168 RepID=UPI00196577AA|nr:sarcosine dehydrogenase, mitochondrial-like [Perca fluviatilis]
MQIKNECLTCRHGVAVFDMSYFGKFYLSGPDAKKAADWLFTADVNKKPGDAYYLAIGGGVAEHNWNHIRTVLQDRGFHCQLTDHSEDMGMISIQGPKSREVLQEVLDTDLNNEAFPFSTHKVVNTAGHQPITALERDRALQFAGWVPSRRAEACRGAPWLRSGV